ncbi:MAG: SemiSWEET family transporter [Candidatus Babeliales bacterium]|jgi:uncharacterized protein with PQ loop repeat
MKEKFLLYYKHYMYVIGFVGQLVFVFQANRIWQTGCSSDVSLLGFLSAFISTCSWSFYGYLIGNPILMRANAFGAIAGSVCLAMIFIYS